MIITGLVETGSFVFLRHSSSLGTANKLVYSQIPCYTSAVGNYRSATAGAVGAFYKPTGNIMVAVKGSFGSDENMVSGGVGISLNKGNVPGVSKAQLVRTINAQAGQIQQQANEIQNMKVAHQSEISNLQAQISALATKVNEMQK